VQWWGKRSSDDRQTVCRLFVGNDYTHGPTIPGPDYLYPWTHCIRESTAVAEVNKKNEDLPEVLPDLPAAVERFKRGENVTIKLLREILLACYDVDMPKSGKKKEEYEKS
jgi:hypothetical protein